MFSDKSFIILVGQIQKLASQDQKVWVFLKLLMFAAFRKAGAVCARDAWDPVFHTLLPGGHCICILSVRSLHSPPAALLVRESSCCSSSPVDLSPATGYSGERTAVSFTPAFSKLCRAAVLRWVRPLLLRQGGELLLGTLSPKFGPRSSISLLGREQPVEGLAPA